MNIFQHIQFLEAQIRLLSCKLQTSPTSNGVESDPTVPTWVKTITQADITKWNNPIQGGGGNLVEVDTLFTVMGRGNVTNGPSIFFSNPNVPLQLTATSGINLGTVKASGLPAIDSITLGTNNGASNTVSNILIGKNTLTKSATSRLNIAIGFDSLTNLEDSLYNSATCPAITGTKSWGNVAVGENSLILLKNGIGNVALGVDAGRSLGRNNPGDYNTFLGFRAGGKTLNLWGDCNVIIGANAPVNAQQNGTLIIHAQHDSPQCLPGGNAQASNGKPLVHGNFIGRWIKFGGVQRLDPEFTTLTPAEIPLVTEMVVKTSTGDLKVSSITAEILSAIGRMSTAEKTIIANALRGL